MWLGTTVEGAAAYNLKYFDNFSLVVYASTILSIVRIGIFMSSKNGFGLGS